VTALGEHLAALEVERAARSDAERAAAKVEQKGRGAVAVLILAGVWFVFFRT
jgi:hypothetical protein